MLCPRGMTRLHSRNKWVQVCTCVVLLSGAAGEARLVAAWQVKLPAQAARHKLHNLATVLCLG